MATEPTKKTPREELEQELRCKQCSWSPLDLALRGESAATTNVLLAALLHRIEHVRWRLQ